jgi:deazaflavin-dependent oxidoreductase (nitroreductase family)
MGLILTSIAMRGKRAAVTAFQKRILNPVVRRAVQRGIAPPGWAILETTGRKSGLTRRNPVGDGLRGDTFWIVAEHGRKAGYVRNIEANPRVRVYVRGRWRTGTARTLPGDDPRARQRDLPRLNAFFVRTVGTDLLTVRVDLDPDEDRTPV